MKTIAEMIKVMQAFADGRAILYMSRHCPGDGWNVATYPSWDWSQCDYKAIIPPLKIDWNAIQQQWKYVAMDKTGNVTLFTHKPTFSGSIWIASPAKGSRMVMHVERFLDSVVIPKGLEAIDSLIERPI